MPQTRNNKPGTPDNTDSDLQYIASGTSLVFLGTVFSNALLLAHEIISARVIGARLLGVYYLGMSISKLMVPVALLGLTRGLLRYVGQLHSEGDAEAIRGTIRRVIGMTIPIAVLLCGVLLLLAPQIATGWFGKSQLISVISLLAIAIPFECLTQIGYASLQALRAIRKQVILQGVTIPLIRLASVAVLLLLGWRLMAVVAGYLFATTVGATLSMIALGSVLSQQPEQKHQEAARAVSHRELVSFSIPLLLSTLLNIPAKRMVIWLLGATQSGEAVAVYGVLMRLRRLGTIVLASLNNVFAPVISALCASGEIQKLGALYSTATRWVVSMSLPIYLLLATLAAQVLGIFGSEFVLGTVPLMVVCCGEVVNSLVGSSGNVLVMSGHSKISLYNRAASAVLAAILGLLLIPQYGVLGAAITISTEVVCMNLLQVTQVYAILRIHPYERRYLVLLLSALVALLGGLVAQHLVVLPAPYDAIVYAAIFIGIYLGMLYSRGFGEEARDLLGMTRLASRRHVG